MKITRILVVCAALLASITAAAGPNSIVFTQRNAADTGNVLYTPLQPAVNSIVFFNAATQRANYLTLGQGLVINAGTLAASVPNGPPGVDGRSAYQIAVAGGYFGTEAQWLISLKGTDGAPGQSIVGPQGPQGIPGIGEKGDKGDTGAQGIQGVPGLAGTPAPTFNYGSPAARTIAVSTAYQATNTAKAAEVTVSPSCSASLTLAGGSTCTLQARIGAAPLTCSSGTVVATWTNGNTGALTVGLALNQIVGSPYSIKVPIGASFILCPTAGTFTVTAAEQSAG